MTPAPHQYHWIVPLVAALSNLALCIVVYRRHKTSRLHQAFALLTLNLLFWNLDIFSLFFARTAEEAFFWSRLFRVGMLLTPVALLMFVVTFAHAQGWWVRVAVGGGCVVGSGLVLANALDGLTSTVERVKWGFYTRPLPLYSLFTVWFVVTLMIAAVVLVHAYRRSASASWRLQARFWMVGVSIAAVLGSTNLLAVYGVSVYPLGNIGSLAWVAIVAYAIIRHRLMDIDLFITKGVAYIAGSLAVIGPAFIAVLVMERVEFGQVHNDFSLAILVLLSLVAVFFHRLRLRTESRIEHSLLGDKYAYRRAISAFARSLIRILDRDKLVRELAETLSESLQLDRIGVVLGDGSGRNFVLRYKRGNADWEMEFPATSCLVRILNLKRRALLRAELEGIADNPESQIACNQYQRNGWEVCIPLLLGENLLGFVSLGPKRNLDAYYAEDLSLLETLAAEASVALENARLYEELKKSQEIIRRADRLSALGTLAAGIAHEVRNPLVAIQTFFQLAPERLNDEEFLTTFLSMSAGEVKRITDLINELLTFARSPSRALEFVDINGLVDRVAKLLEPEARKHRLSLTRRLSPNLPSVNADRNQIKQVLINLILNAIEATEPGGDVYVVTSPIYGEGTAFGQVEIRDTGIGISKDFIDHIFDPFFTTKASGNGLGLAIAHQIIAEHGGSISVESEPGCGTSFFIRLPAALEGSIVDEADDHLASNDTCHSSHTPARKIAS